MNVFNILHLALTCVNKDYNVIINYIDSVMYNDILVQVLV